MVFSRVNSVDTNYLNRIIDDLTDVFNKYILDKNVIYFVPLFSILLLGLFLKKKKSSAFMDNLKLSFSQPAPKRISNKQTMVSFFIIA